jgi:hypothetical protein
MRDEAELDPITGRRVIGSQIACECGVTVRYTWVRGFDPELGFGQEWWGMTGWETRYRRVVPPVAATFEVVEKLKEAA